MYKLAFALVALVKVSLVGAVPIDWRTAQVISHSKNMGCLQSCGTDKLQETAETSVTIQSALSPITTINPVHVGILLMIAFAAVGYQFFRLRRDTYRLLEESKPPAPETA